VNIFWLWNCDGRACDDCEDGVKTFENTRYKGYVEILGVIVGHSSYDVFAIAVKEEEFNKHKHLFNELDLIAQQKHEPLNCDELKFSFLYEFGFYSKKKFIKTTNEFAELRNNFYETF